jgi:acyl carrier protein
METVAQKTKRIISEALRTDMRLLTYDTDLRHDLGADSLDILEVITLLENEFGVSVTNEKIQNMRRVGDLIKYFGETKHTPLYSQRFQAA